MVEDMERMPVATANRDSLDKPEFPSIYSSLQFFVSFKFLLGVSIVVGVLWALGGTFLLGESAILHTFDNDSYHKTRPPDLRQLISKASAEAKASHAISSIHINEFSVVDNGEIKFVVSTRGVTPGKPNSLSSTPGISQINLAPIDALDVRNIDPLLIIHRFEEEHFTLALNKFNTISDHTLLITDVFEDQIAPVSASQFDLWSWLVDSVNGVGFYNSNAVAGASQRHKHLQMAPLDVFWKFRSSDELYPIPLDDLILPYVERGEWVAHPSISDQHVVARHLPQFHFQHAIAVVSDRGSFFQHYAAHENNKNKEISKKKIATDALDAQYGAYLHRIYRDLLAHSGVSMEDLQACASLSSPSSTHSTAAATASSNNGASHRKLPENDISGIAQPLLDYLINPNKTAVINFKMKSRHNGTSWHGNNGGASGSVTAGQRIVTVNNGTRMRSSLSPIIREDTPVSEESAAGTPSQLSLSSLGDKAAAAGGGSGGAGAGGEMLETRASKPMKGHHSKEAHHSSSSSSSSGVKYVSDAANVVNNTSSDLVGPSTSTSVNVNAGAPTETIPGSNNAPLKSSKGRKDGNRNNNSTGFGNHTSPHRSSSSSRLSTNSSTGTVRMHDLILTASINPVARRLRGAVPVSPSSSSLRVPLCSSAAVAYNLILTQNYMMIVPRQQLAAPLADGTKINVNSFGFMGYLLASGTEQAECIRTASPLSILQTVAAAAVTKA